MKRVKTVLACWDEATDTALEVLGDGFAVTVAHTFGDVQRALASQPFELIVATLRFDESRPLELIPLARGPGVPVALVRFGVSHLPPALVKCVFIAANSLGCAATFDLSEASKAIGREAAIVELRLALRTAALLADKP